jgi:hypothetical protein
VSQSGDSRRVKTFQKVADWSLVERMLCEAEHDLFTGIGQACILSASIAHQLNPNVLQCFDIAQWNSWVSRPGKQVDDDRPP